MIVRRFPQTLVTWRVDTCELVEVTPLSEKTGPLQYTSSPLHRTWTSEGGIPYASRYFNWVNMTEIELREDLCRLVDEKTLDAIFKEWEVQPIRELISILETGIFPSPTFRRDTYHLLDCLFEFHEQELDEALCARLWQLIQAGTLDRQEEMALRFRLYVHEQRTSEFVEYWATVRDEGFKPWGLGYFCIDNAGTLQVTDQRVVADLIKLLQDSRFKCRAMIALGKIGSSAGPEAVRAIKTIVSGITTQQRDRVLQRILTTGEEWKRCDVCQNGKVLEGFEDRMVWQDCSECYGLTWRPP